MVALKLFGHALVARGRPVLQSVAIGVGFDANGKPQAGMGTDCADVDTPSTGLGAGDGLPDIFVTNFKVTDIVSHQYSMDSEDEAIALEAQDGALDDLLDYLNVNVGGDYVVIVTADHGAAPADGSLTAVKVCGRPPSERMSWP